MPSPVVAEQLARPAEHDEAGTITILVLLERARVDRYPPPSDLIEWLLPEQLAQRVGAGRLTATAKTRAMFAGIG